MLRAIPTLESIRLGGKSAVARALALIETADGTADLAGLLDEAAIDPRGDVLGLTGPPGVGKSTLTNLLIARFRGASRTVAVVAIDPSSRQTGGALLGDRTRLRTDPDDSGVFVRSMAARDRLGGLSDHAIAAIVLMRALYDLVIVESVGVGQSEGDIAEIADTVLLLVQPGSGDSLQFMKSGVMELPDVIAVTKSDIGDAARRAVADVTGALTLRKTGGPDVAVVPVSALDGSGLDDLMAALAAHRATTMASGDHAARRANQPERWVADCIRRRFGSEGAAVVLPSGVLDEVGGPFSAMRAITLMLRKRLSLT